MIYVKYHKDVVAICDGDLIGKKFEDEDRQLDVTERFYKGKEATVEEIRDILKEGGNMNLVGEKVIGLAVEEGIVNEDDVIEIQGVKHAQVYSVD